MTVTELSNISKEILFRCERVSIPSMGTLFLEHIPSQIINDGTAITPPGLSINFDSSDSNAGSADSELVVEYAAQKCINLIKAEEEVRSLVNSLKRELLEHSQLLLPEFGRVVFSDNSTFIFEPHPSLDSQVWSFGLDVLPLKAIQEQEFAQEQADNKSEQYREPEPDYESVPHNINNKRFSLSLLIVLSVIGLVVLLVFAVVIFKEELTPLLERILYSEEELRFIREYGL